MKLITVGAAALNQTPLDWANNQSNIRDAIAIARQDHISILCLPELCVTGYGCEDAFHAPETNKRAFKLLQELLPETRGMIVAIGLPVFFRNALFNCACLLVDGQIAGFTAKQFLAGDGIHYEPRWFKPWPQGVCSEIELDGMKYSIGDLHFNCGGIKVGFEICEDAWVANRPGAQLASLGVDIILNPSASHFAFGKMEVRKRFVLEGSRSFGCSYVYANLLGNEAGRAIYDGGLLIASGGKLVAASPRFSYENVLVTHAVIDVEASRMSQARTVSFQPGMGVDNQNCVQMDFEFPPAELRRQPLEMPRWENSSRIKEEEFARAIALALFDYLRKSRSGGFVVSLSGGADSSAVSCLVALAIRFAEAEIGIDPVKAKLAYLKDVQSASSSREMIRLVLTCVYQSTRNSTQTTRHAAQELAGALGADFIEWDVDEIVRRYIKTVSTVLQRDLTWDNDDIALQNIQARVRSPGVWLLANLRNALLLSTSNRSEAAVGYATMDGDTSGGLSPVAGIDKAFLIQWLEWMERQGPEGLHSIPALSFVTAQNPTAELRPPEHHQTDEKDMMPYVVLDAIERAAIRDKLSPSEVHDVLLARFPEHPSALLAVWIERFFRLWCRNQWKRERYAPSFHVDDENLDPKTWCRFPILSGGYEAELADLRFKAGL